MVVNLIRDVGGSLASAQSVRQQTAYVARAKVLANELPTKPARRFLPAQ
jgi:hypothetical protein